LPKKACNLARGVAFFLCITEASSSYRNTVRMDINMYFGIVGNALTCANQSIKSIKSCCNYKNMKITS
jgi:hypothetical protein